MVSRDEELSMRQNMEVDEYQAWLDAYYGYVVLPPPLPGLWLTQDWSQVSYTKSPWRTLHLS